MTLCVPLSIYNCKYAFYVDLVYMYIDDLECHIWMKVFPLNVIKTILRLKKTFFLYSYVLFLTCLHCL